MSSAVEVRKTIQNLKKEDFIYLETVADDSSYIGCGIQEERFDENKFDEKKQELLDLLDGLGKTAKTTREIELELKAPHVSVVSLWEQKWVRWEDDKGDTTK